MEKRSGALLGLQGICCNAARGGEAMRAVIGALACAALLASGGAGKGAEPPAVGLCGQPAGPAAGAGRWHGATRAGKRGRFHARLNCATCSTLPDWYPDDHPPMPNAVAFGSKPAAFACGFCHTPERLRQAGKCQPRRPSAEYMSSRWPISETDRERVQLSSAHADDRHRKRRFDADLKSAAAYFSSLKTAPLDPGGGSSDGAETRVLGFMLVPDGSGESEPIGDRVIEMPEDVPRTELRNSRSGFIAYAPPGSLRAGRGAGYHRRLRRDRSMRDLVTART